MALFQTTVVQKYLKAQDQNIINEKWETYKTHFHNPSIQQNVRNAKEEQYQEGFLRDLFVNVLGYMLNPETNFNLTTELKNVKDAKKADGGILVNDKVVGVIELKGTDTTDLSKVESQAFGYKNNQKNCAYVITSNFEKLRFYIDNAIEHQAFDLFQLTEKEFKLLYLCLAYENISKDIPKKLKSESLSQEDVITKQLYKDYSLFKRELFNNLTELNPDIDPLLLFKKSQKLLDRFLFLFFAEDRHLLPPNSVRLVLQQWKKLKELDAYTPLFERYKKYFGYLNTGYKGKKYDVYPYNGGLFKPDEILDNIKIDDGLLYKHTLKLSEYDFDSEVDVNILGHIFENSLNEIEEIQTQLEEDPNAKPKVSKRKKDGVFYTPKYITKYIVENTVGKLCEERKESLAIVEEEYNSKRQKKTKETLLGKLKTYRQWLLQLTIVDPACGSGAFLNEALNYLIAEHKYVDELETKLMGGGFVFPNVENSILENNLFGVDINNESVEIAKLSLWLRTAQPNRKLNDLSHNIKCGNSLIDDPEVAGDKAFNWETEFPQVFAKGGFDVVIGNPPYVIVYDEKIKKYLENTFKVFKRNNDLYTAFYQNSIKIMNDYGYLGFITPNSFIKGSYFKPLREHLIKNCIIKIVDFNNELVFEDANVFSAILIMTKGKTHSDWQLYSNINTLKGKVLANSLSFIPLNKIQEKLTTFDVFEDHFLIKDVGFNYWSKGRGKVRGDSVGSRVLYNGKKENENDIPYIKGSDFRRYTSIRINNFLRHNYDSFLNDNDIFRYSPEILETNPKIIYRQTSSTLIATIDKNSYYCDKTVHVIINRKNSSFNLSYVLAIFNSKLLNYLYKLFTEESGRAFAQVKTVNVKKLPFADASIDTKKGLIDRANRNLNAGNSLQKIVEKFVRSITRKYPEQLEKLPRKLNDWYELSFSSFIKELHKKKIKLSLSEESEWEDYFLAEQQKALDLQAQINATDKEIDQMVYELYGLTKEEIEVVENS